MSRGEFEGWKVVQEETYSRFDVGQRHVEWTGEFWSIFRAAE